MGANVRGVIRPRHGFVTGGAAPVTSGRVCDMNGAAYFQYAITCPSRRISVAPQYTWFFASYWIAS
jgi:hypothetical protein